MPLIQLSGGLGSTGNTAPSATEWARIGVAIQEEKRRAMLTEQALEEGRMQIEALQRQVQSDDATAQGYSQLAQLPRQAQQGAQAMQGIQAGMGAAGAAMGVPGMGGKVPTPGPTDLMESGLEQIVKRAQGNGASPKAMQTLLFDGRDILQQAAAMEDLQTLDQAWQTQAQHDPVAAQVYQQMGQLAPTVGADPIKLRELHAKLYSEEQHRQTKLAGEIATSEMLAAQIGAVLDPTGPFGQFFAAYDHDGSLRASMLEPLLQAQARNGAPGILKTDIYTQQQRDFYARTLAQGGGSPTGGQPTPEPAPAPERQAPPASGPIGEAIEKRKAKAQEAERGEYTKTAKTWRKGFSDAQRSELLLSLAAEIDRKGGTPTAAQEALADATSKGVGTWTGSKAEGDPDLAADLAYILSLPAKERKAALEDMLGDQESSEKLRRETRAERRIGTRAQ